MSIIIGHASLGENGARNNKAGDSTGKEVCTRSYYLHSKGWYLFRAKSISVANALAEAMLEACANNNIGYDQGGRSGVITQLNKYGSLEKIAVKTECDCSSLVRACCIQAGFDPGNFTTGTEPTYLDKTDKFYDRIEVTEDTELFNGDILVTKTKGHTVIVVSGNPRKEEVKAPKLDTARYKESGHGGGTAFKTTTALNMRVGAGTSKDKITVLKQNTKVVWYGFYNKVGTTKWYLVVVGDHTGYVSSKYLKRV